MLIKIPKGWEIPEHEAISESVYLNRRQFLVSAGVVGVSTMGLFYDCNRLSGDGPETKPLSAWRLTKAEEKIYPAPRKPEFKLDRPITTEAIATRYNNFYEFSSSKDDVWKKAEGLVINPWQVEVTGLVEKPHIFDIDELIRLMPIEERLYRLRCVEAWAMAVTWTGFPMKALIDYVRPLSKARFVRFVSFVPERRRHDEKVCGPLERRYRFVNDTCNCQIPGL